MTEDETRGAIIVSEGGSSVVFGLDDSDPNVLFQLLTPDGTVFASVFEDRVVLDDGSEFPVDDDDSTLPPGGGSGSPFENSLTSACENAAQFMPFIEPGEFVQQSGSHPQAKDRASMIATA